MTSPAAAAADDLKQRRPVWERSAPYFLVYHICMVRWFGGFRAVINGEGSDTDPVDLHL